MVSEWQKFKSLLNEISKNKNTREVIVLLGIYGEYVVSKLLSEKCSTGLDKLNSQDIKLKILFELKELSESEYDVLSKLNSIRNKYAHKLELSREEEERIVGSMKDITINWDEKNEDPRSLEKTIRKAPFAKFQLACVTKIGHLMAKIGKANGEDIKQTVIFDVIIEGKKYKFKAM